MLDYILLQFQDKFNECFNYQNYKINYMFTTTTKTKKESSEFMFYNNFINVRYFVYNH